MMKYNITNRFCAGIVTYNPNINLLRRAVNSIVGQVADVVIIDNASINLSEISTLCLEHENIKLVANKKNVGIATALNQIGDFAKILKCNWFLTLDQDSVCPNNLIEIYSRYVTFNNVGLICPYILQRIHLDRNISIQKKYEYCQIAITSGSLVKTEAWLDVNGFWDDLFIDKVDDDFCLALRDKGWKVLKTYEVKLEHEIGNPKLCYFLGKSFYTDSYSDFRYYYIARNTIIVANNYKYIPYNKNVILLKKFLKIILGERKKAGKVKAFLHGLVDGIKMVRNGFHRY